MEEKEFTQQNKKTNILALCVLILLCTSILSALMTVFYGEGGTSHYTGGSGGKQTLYDSSFAQNYAQIINVYGIIEYEKMLQSVLEKLKVAEKTDTIKAVILRINSPGGTVGASQSMYKALLAFKEKTKKPVLAILGDVAASGGYYIAMASDEIFAQPGTITGSIGVIVMEFSFEKLFSGLGIRQEIVKSGQFKDILSSIATSQTATEKQLLQQIVDTTHSQFYDAVALGRKGRLSPEHLQKYTDGRIFNGSTAQELGFVDKLGGIDDALASLKERFHLKNLVPLDRNQSLFEEVLGYVGNNSKQSTQEFLKSARGIPLYIHTGTNLL